MKKQIDLSSIFSYQHPTKTGVDLHDHQPEFVFDGVVLDHTSHRVPFGWMDRQLPEYRLNKMLYFISADDSTALFGAVVDGVGLLFLTTIE